MKGELKVTALLLCMGVAICAHVALQLGIGTSTVDATIKEVYRAITSQFMGEITFSTTIAQILHTMRGFQTVSGLP